MSIVALDKNNLIKADIARNPNSQYYLYITIFRDTLVGFNNLFAQKKVLIDRNYDFNRDPDFTDLSLIR